LAPLILAFLLAELLVVQYDKYSIVMFISQLQYHMSYINQDRIYQLQHSTVLLLFMFTV